MNDEKSHESDAPSTNSGVETSYEELYQKARNMTQFEKYTDFELKERLVNLIFTMDGSNLIQTEVDEDEDAVSFELRKEHKIKEIFSKLEKSLKTVRISKDRELKSKILSRKTEYIATVKEGLPVVYDNKSLQALLFALACEMDICHNDVFWDFNLFNDKDFLRFHKDVANGFYLAKISFIGKLWDMFTGQRKLKLELLDPFNQFQVYPRVKRHGAYGSNYFINKKMDVSWAAQFFGEISGTPNFIPMEQFSLYSLKSIVLSLSKTFDDIFKWSNVRFSEKNEQQDEKTRNEGLLFKLVTESYLPAIKMLTVFEHIALTLPQTANHPLRSIHLVYFVAWMYVKWIPFLERSLSDNRNFVTPAGETGDISLDSIFDKMKGQMDSELVSVNFDDDFGMFHSYFSERDSVLTKIDYYKSLIPQLKRRVKYILSSLIGDMITDYVSKKGFFLDYSIDERGRLNFIDLFKSQGSSLLDRALSIFKQDKEKETDKSQIPSSEKEAVAPVATTVTRKPVQSPADDSMRYSRALDDVLTILSAVITVFNENFEGVNKFMSMAGQEEDIYHYLSVNPYFKLNDNVSFELVMSLQDCFELMHRVKIIGNQVIQAIKDKEIPRSLTHKKINLEDKIENLITSMKDSSMTLGLLSQDKNKYQEYGVLINKIQFVNKEFQRVKKLSA